MKIGLVRHYKVKKELPKTFLIDYPQLLQWFVEYETAEAEPMAHASTHGNWQSCYSSPSQRAVFTAKSIFKGEPVIIHALNELNIVPHINKNLKLPYFIWGILIHNKSMGDNEFTRAYKAGMNAFIDTLLQQPHKEVLVVSHFFAMLYLKRELQQRGFTGEKFSYPQNGRTYVYSKL